MGRQPDPWDRFFIDNKEYMYLEIRTILESFYYHLKKNFRKADDILKKADNAKIKKKPAMPLFDERYSTYCSNKECERKKKCKRYMGSHNIMSFSNLHVLEFEDLNCQFFIAM